MLKKKQLKIILFFHLQFDEIYEGYENNFHITQFQGLSMKNQRNIDMQTIRNQAKNVCVNKP